MINNIPRPIFLANYDGQVINDRKLRALGDYLFDGYYRYYLYRTIGRDGLIIDIVPWRGYDITKIKEDRRFRGYNIAMKDYSIMKDWIYAGNGFDGEHMPIDFSAINTLDAVCSLSNCFATYKTIDSFTFTDKTIKRLNMGQSKILTGLHCSKLDLINSRKATYYLSTTEELTFEYVYLSKDIYGSSYALSNPVTQMMSLIIDKHNVKLVLIDESSKGSIDMKYCESTLKSRVEVEYADIQNTNIRNKARKLQMLHGERASVVCLV